MKFYLHVMNGTFAFIFTIMATNLRLRKGVSNICDQLISESQNCVVKAFIALHTYPIDLLVRLGRSNSSKTDKVTRNDVSWLVQPAPGEQREPTPAYAAHLNYRYYIHTELREGI